MSNLSQRNRYKILCLFAFILLIGEVKAFEFGASPGIINFELDEGARECRNISIIAGNKTLVEVNDFWSSGGDKDLENYNLKAEGLGVNIDYQKRIYADGRSSLNICASALKSGNYHGLLTLSPIGKNVELGVWLDMKVGNAGDTGKNDSLAAKLLTGDVVGGELGYNSIFLSSGLVFSCLLSGVLLFLLIRLKRKTGLD